MQELNCINDILFIKYMILFLCGDKNGDFNRFEKSKLLPVGQIISLAVMSALIIIASLKIFAV